MQTGFQTHWLASTADLLAHAAPWNDLWQRSQSARPTSRAEQLALWCERFAGSSFGSIVVGDGERLVAALPLTQSQRWPVSVLRNPGNSWTPAGELLVDVDESSPAVVAPLVDGLIKQARGLVWLDGLIQGCPFTQTLLSECSARGISQSVRSRFDVPLVEIKGTWGAFLASRSRNVRRQLRAVARRAQAIGGIELQRYEAASPRQAESLARECFNLEASGWKGQAESAVLNSPIATEFFLAQACQLAADGQLAIAVLRHRGDLIAFEYGWQTHGVRGVLKIGYHQRYARLSPGQLLRYRLLSELFGEGTVRWIDFLGPGSRATRAWATHHYEVGRVICALNSPIARLALTACQTKRTLLRRASAPYLDSTDASTPAALPARFARECARV